MTKCKHDQIKQSKQKNSNKVICPYCNEQDDISNFYAVHRKSKKRLSCVANKKQVQRKEGQITGNQGVA